LLSIPPIMLPLVVFDQLTRTSGLRSDRTASERRVGVRIPLKIQISVHLIEGGVLAEPIAVRTKDISRTGISFIDGGRSNLAAEFILRLQPAKCGPVWLWCALRRRNDCDRTCMVFSCSFLKILLPGQDLRPGAKPTNLAWLDVEGEATPDGQAFKLSA